MVQYTTEVDPDAAGAPGALDNQVTVGGDAVDSSGNPLADSMGNPIGVTDNSVVEPIQMVTTPTHLEIMELLTIQRRC